MSISPGIHSLSAAAYHADPCPVPSLSASIAKLLAAKSPLHAWFSHPRLNPKFMPVESDTFDYGTAAHAMLLEGRKDGLMVVEADDWRSKAARELRQQARETGKTPILARQLAKVEAMVGVAQDRVYHSELRGLFEAGRPELSLVWSEGPTWLRSRLDWLTNDGLVLLDYKTTSNAEPNAFGRSAWSLGYELQAEFYLRGLSAVGNRKATFVFLAQEVEPPFACSLVSLDPQAREIGIRKVEDAISQWAHCMKTGKWNGYPSQIAYLSPPQWAASQYLEAA